MNVATITMPKEQAIAAYREYRRAVQDNPNAQDRAIVLGYQALAKGRAVIDLVEAMRSAGIHEVNKLPKLAIARANWEYVDFRTNTWGRRGRRWDFERWPNPRGAQTRVSMPSDALDRRADNARNGRAVVPIIPPKLRPAGDLNGYCILWEADWRRPPGDPLLLKHLAGKLYAVLAVWDLTPLERSVLGARVPSV